MDELYMEENSMSVFKSYLRGLLDNLKDIDEAREKKDEEKLKELIKRLIENTQKGIED
ncbi:MAG: hypothetical protein IJ641_07840 [Lachnospiraceae bacterium]|nr:hypothetical protein [Lachnospiraceae bacterium]